MNSGFDSFPIKSTPRSGEVMTLRYPERDDLSDLSETVGMDEFYAKLARYVRCAEAGKETLVTRWGRPVARLVPAALK